MPRAATGPRTGKLAATVLVTCLLLAAGCSTDDGDSRTPAAQSSSITPAASASAAPAAGDLEKAAEPALALVQQYVPEGYATQPVVSGYDWAHNSGQVLNEALQDGHLLQIACSGDGSIAVVLSMSGEKSTKSIPCGKEESVPFKGKLDAVINGQPSNTGVVAWRVLPQA